MVKIVFDVPKKMMENATAPGAAAKPYDICLECPFISETCDGPNVLAMEYSRWVEWANNRAKQRGLTRADISEQSRVPIGTIHSAMSGRNADVRASTLRDITRVLVGGCWGQYPCHFAALMMRGELAEDDGTTDELSRALKDTRQELDNATAELEKFRAKDAAYEQRRKEDISEAKGEAQRKVDFLTSQIGFKDSQIVNLNATIRHKDRALAMLGIAFGVFALFVLGVLMYDALSPNIGFFRY